MKPLEITDEELKALIESLRPIIQKYRQARARVKAKEKP